MVKIETLKESEYQEILGVRKATYEKMLEELERVHEEESRKAGRPNYKLTVSDKLVIMLKYLREYNSMKSIAVDYNVSKNAVWKSIRWSENILIKEKFLHIDGKKVLINPESAIEAVLIDVMESEIERPQKGRKNNYSGKKNGTR